MSQNQTDAIKERDRRTQAVIDRLLAAPKGTLVAYAELNRLVRGNVQGDLRWCLAGAMKSLRRDHRVVCECVADVGVEVLTDHDIAARRRRYTRRVNRMASRNLDKLSCADGAALPAKERDAVDRQKTLLFFVAAETSPRRARAVESGPIDRRPALPDASDLEGM